MRETYHEQLGQVREELVRTTQLVGRSMQRATRSLLDADLRLAESVIADDADIDSLAHDIDELCYHLTATQAPVATDLRVVMAGVRISGSLERMGDLAVHVAKQARLRYPRIVLPTPVRSTFAQMGTLAEVIVNKTGVVLATNDLGMAPDVKRHDEAMNNLHRELFTTVLSDSWTYGVESAIDVTLLSRYYERFADHAVTIVRRVTHVVTGEPYAMISLD